MAENRWTQPASPPPPLFVGRAERDFVKQINDEIIEHVVGQHTLHHIRTAPTALTPTREYHYTRITPQNKLKRVLRNRITVVTI